MFKPIYFGVEQINDVIERLSFRLLESDPESLIPKIVPLFKSNIKQTDRVHIAPVPSCCESLVAQASFILYDRLRELNLG